MADISDLNKIAQIVIEVFEDADFDQAYIHSKIEDLSQKDQWQTLFWCTHQLDSKNTARFADKVGVSINDLITTFETVRSIEFK